MATDKKQSVNITVRIDKQQKEDFEAALALHNKTITDAVKDLVEYVLQDRQYPFEAKISLKKDSKKDG